MAKIFIEIGKDVSFLHVQCLSHLHCIVASEPIEHGQYALLAFAKT